MWEQFVEISTAMGLSNSRALEQAAALWLYQQGRPEHLATPEDSFQNPRRIPHRVAIHSDGSWSYEPSYRVDPDGYLIEDEGDE